MTDHDQPTVTRHPARGGGVTKPARTPASGADHASPQVSTNIAASGRGGSANQFDSLGECFAPYGQGRTPPLTVTGQVTLLGGQEGATLSRVQGQALRAVLTALMDLSAGPESPSHEVEETTDDP